MSAPKARNMKARGKREAQRNASPLVTKKYLNRALKVRNTNVNYSALSELHGHCASLPGATRLTLFGACPWLSYSAPLALGACPWLSYSAPLALSSDFLCKAGSRYSASAIIHNHSYMCQRVLTQFTK